MLTTNGFVCEIWHTIQLQNHWNSYYKWLEYGKWSWLQLGLQLLRLSVNFLPEDAVIYLLLDDSFIYRQSKKAPAASLHHQHGNKANRPTFAWGQCIVTMATSVARKNGEITAIPFLSRLISKVGNGTKVTAAKALIRVVSTELSTRKTRLLVDCWYMKRSLVEAAIAKGWHVIGQARKDLCLYDSPEKNKVKKRGRPKKYGEKLTLDRQASLKRSIKSLNVYGKSQKVRFASAVVHARFLQGRQVKAVWSQLQKDNGQWKAATLIISTDISLTAEEIIEDYARRWSIETSFNQLKLAWGMKECWQQSKQVLMRWMHLQMTGYGLAQLLSCLPENKLQALCNHSPWRVDNPITAGHLRKGLVKNLRDINIRSWWNRKSLKFEPKNYLESG